jgi:hypothetical protein
MMQRSLLLAALVALAAASDACPPGRTGQECDLECEDNMFGQNCALQCNCVNGECDKVTGECSCTEGETLFFFSFILGYTVFWAKVSGNSF